MQQPGAARGAGPGQAAHRVAVDPQRLGLARLGGVRVGPRSAVDDDRGPGAPHGPGHRVGVGQVQVGVGEGKGGDGRRREPGAQFAAEHAARSGDQPAVHRAASRWARGSRRDHERWQRPPIDGFGGPVGAGVPGRAAGLGAGPCPVRRVARSGEPGPGGVPGPVRSEPAPGRPTRPDAGLRESGTVTVDSPARLRGPSGGRTKGEPGKPAPPVTRILMRVPGGGGVGTAAGGRRGGAVAHGRQAREEGRGGRAGCAGAGGRAERPSGLGVAGRGFGAQGWWPVPTAWGPGGGGRGARQGGTWVRARYGGPVAPSWGVRPGGVVER